MSNIKDSTINFNNVKEGAGVGLTFGGFPVRIDGLTPKWWYHKCRANRLEWCKIR